MDFTGPASSADVVDVSRREVSMRVLTDPAIYEQEMAQIFGRAWLFLGHESEIPAIGDFVQRRMGSDQVIVIRQADGSIEVLLNMCRHRGMEVCRTDVGTARQFHCPYHGWVYGPDGAFMGAPAANQQMHGDILDRSELGLKKAKVELFHGLIFAAWRPATPRFEDHLGEIAPYLRMIFGKTRRGLQVVGPPQRTVIEANWKTAAEQFAGDDYHANSLHTSLVDVLMVDLSDEAKAEIRKHRDPNHHGRHVDVSTPEGHGVMCFPKAGFSVETGEAEFEGDLREHLRGSPPTGISANILDEVIERFDDGALKIMAFCPPQTASIFPTFGAVQSTFPTGSFTCLHTFAPRGPNHFELLTWLLVERDADEETKLRSTRTAGAMLGTAGMVEQDDSDAWPSIQRAARGFMGGQDTIKYQALSGERKPAGWPGGGTVYSGFSKDDNQWAWWLRWREAMSADRSENEREAGLHG